VIDLEWMAWTVPTAIFFIVIASILIAMTLAETRWPSVPRRGWIIPMVTTRGDRLFLSLLLAAFIHLGFVYATDAETLWLPLGLSGIAGAILMRFG
jgi:predicted small integral membrane protein